MVKRSSYQRFMALGTKLDIADITILQSAYINKNPEQIKAIFNKPNISDKTAYAYVRLANQYVEALKQPNKSISKYAQQKYNVNLLDNQSVSTNLATNVSLLNTKFKITQPTKFKLRIPLFPFNYSKFPNRYGVSYENTLGLPNTQTFFYILQNFQYSIGNNLRLYNSQYKPFTQFRITLKYETENGYKEYYSSKRLPIGNIVNSINDLVMDLSITNYGHWSMISPKISDVIQELYNGSDKILKFNYMKIDYFY